MLAGAWADPTVAQWVGLSVGQKAGQLALRWADPMVVLMVHSLVVLWVGQKADQLALRLVDPMAGLLVVLMVGD